MLRRSVYIALLLAICCVSASSQGLKLFSPELKKAVPRTQAVVMDFLERYFSELPKQKLRTASTKMADDRVYFRNGRLSDLSQIADTMPFSIKLSYRYYEVEWIKPDSTLVTIVFPAQYDLLLGKPDEVQHQLRDTILAAPYHSDSIMAPGEKVMLDDSVYMAKTGYLELESMNDATYYNKIGDSYQPVYDSAQLEYSAANLFHGLIAGADYQMDVEQSVYGLKTINYTITLRQWLNYCAEWGLKVFYGVEQERKDGLLVLVIVQSNELEFNHQLSVFLPDKFVTDKTSVFKVRMTPYIPTHNIKNLFEKEYDNHQKIKWQ